MLAMAIGAPLSAGGKAGPVISLVCVPDERQTEPLCAQMRAVIAEAMPGHEVLAAPADATASDATELRLDVQSRSRFGLTARLDWRLPGQNWQLGEKMSLSVMDHELTDEMIAQFLQLLWSRSPIAG